MNKYSVFFVSIIFSWIVAILYVATASLPYNPIRPPFANVINWKMLVPEGWGFFTRNPREPNIYLLKKENNTWVSCFRTNPDPINLFGIKRFSRSQGVEYGLLLQQTSAEDWTKCEEVTLDDCVKKKNKRIVTVLNSSTHSSLCGQILFVQQAPLPWAWSRSNNKINMPLQYLILNVKCEK